MKALTLRHPWPFAICRMGKRFENRSWKPPQGLIGHRIAIHGGKVPAANTELREVMRCVQQLTDKFGTPSGFQYVTANDVLACSGIVAIATLTGYLTITDDLWFDRTGYRWQLSDVAVLHTPVPCKGAQGLWKVPDDVLQVVNARLAYRGE